MYKRSFYQDRLGTNISKLTNRERCVYRTAVQLGGPYIPGKNGPIPEPYVWPRLQARIPHRMACGGGALDDPGCSCGDEERCGRVPFADTFLVGATLGQSRVGGRIGPPRGR
jgi:hypothetical protein